MVRSTFAVETMAALEAVESGDLVRARPAGTHYKLRYRAHADDVTDIKVIYVTAL